MLPFTLYACIVNSQEIFSVDVTLKSRARTTELFGRILFLLVQKKSKVNFNV